MPFVGFIVINRLYSSESSKLFKVTGMESKK